MASESRKRVPLMGETKRSHKGPDLESRVFAPVQLCYFWKETPKFPRHYELEPCHDEAAMTSFPTVLFFYPLTERIRRREMFL